jgi:hypothetical protein
MAEIDVERLLQWAYRDELPKQGIGDVANDWDRVTRYGELLSIVDDDRRRFDDPGFPVIMGAPHPDALTISRAVQGLAAEVVIDWRECRALLMGDLHLLAPVESPFLISSPNERGRDVDVRGGSARVVRETSAARDMVFSEVALVETFARLGRRPEWNAGDLRPRRVINPKNHKVTIVGECKGADIYTPGSYCPLQYVDPTVDQVAIRRAEYFVWRGALDRLVGILRAWLLTDHTPGKPTAPIAPWLDAQLDDAARPAPIPGPSSFKSWLEPAKPKGAKQRRNREGVPTGP